MSTEPKPQYGTVRNGVIVPDDPTAFKEGFVVEIIQVTLEFTPEERAEFEAWDRLSEKAWAMIDELEREEAAQNQPPTAGSNDRVDRHD